MSAGSVIPWSPDRMLEWSDFAAEPNPAAYENASSFLRYGHTWTVKSDEVDGSVVFAIEDLEITPEFHPMLSWVRMPYATGMLLAHQQGHFDLAETVRREHLGRIRERFYGRHYAVRGKNREQGRQFAKEDSGMMISVEIERLEKILGERRAAYARDTDYGQDASRQDEYDAVFARVH